MTYEEKVWDTINRAWNGDLKAQLSLLCVDVALNGDSRLIKEEKKMLNVDKYREEFKKRQGWAEREQTEKPAFQIWGEIAYTFGQGEKSARGLVEWLFSEYEPPLLENGDGLKPGDWIMVRNGDGVSWRKRQFMCYFDNRFYCFKPLSQFKNECDCVMWAQARLLEEGE